MFRFSQQILVSILVSSSFVNAEKNALDIPRFNTPYNGVDPELPWPGNAGSFGCGIPGAPPMGLLDECTEPINPDAPDISGYWRNTATGTIDEKSEQCGSRWTSVSLSVIHDFPQCTGVVGDGLGCMDWNGAAVIEEGLCSPITVACKFEIEDNQKCINLYTYLNPAEPVGDPFKVVSRCLSDDENTMIFKHPLFGIVNYEKVPKNEEPNCAMCVGGDFDGVFSDSPDDALPCSYKEREWVQCPKGDLLKDKKSKKGKKSKKSQKGKKGKKGKKV